MGKVFIEESNLTAIGDAIREKTGNTDLINPTAMPEEIKNIETGSNEPKTMMVRSTRSYLPSYVDGKAQGGSTFWGTSSSNRMDKYYWYRTDNTQIYWNVARWTTGYFTEGHRYRLSFWIWHTGELSNEPIALWQNTFFINSNTIGEINIDKITTEPQLVSVEVNYVPESVYGFSLYIYPEASGNQVRLTPIVIEDLTEPSTDELMPL